MKLGDHIRTLANGRFDHAIDCGDLTVIHLVPAPGGVGRAEVRRSRLSDFTAGAERVEGVTYPQRGYAPRMVVARAFSRLGDSAAWAMFRSAEHFATWCVNGQAPAATPAGPEAAASAPPRPARPAGRARPRAKAARKAAARRKAPPSKPARRKAPRRKASRPARKGTARPRRGAKRRR